MGRKVPEPVEHAVASLMKKRKISRQKAYQIIVGRWQKLGYLKKGSLDLTEKGKRKLSKHYREPKKVRLAKVNLARKHKVKKL